MYARSNELEAGFKKMKITDIKGKRKVNVTSLIKTQAVPEDICTVSIPALNANQCIIPDTLALSFKFSNSNTKSWFKNNLGRLLVDRLTVNVEGKNVYENTGESLMEVYKDLWRSEEDRDNRQNFGIANENVRKLVSKDDSANKNTKTDGVLDSTIADMMDRMKIPLGKILCDHGPYAPYGMSDFEYRITLPGSDKIMVAQTNEAKGTYKLTDMHLEYEIIESESLANRVRGDYNAGRSLGYDYTTLLKTLVWDKDSTRQVVDINIPRKSMTGVVLLFTKKGSTDSEEFLFPNLTNVDVSVEGTPNAIYSDGLKKRDMYKEAVRFFGSSTCDKYLGSKCISRRKYYTDKFALVVDFRTVDDDTVSGSGRELVGTQAGILMEIEKEATTSDLNCHVFVLADAMIDIVGTKLNGSVKYQ